MKDYSAQNKKAWEFNAYDFWIKNAGTPEEMAKKNLENPKKMLRKYAGYFDKFDGIFVGSISCSFVFPCPKISSSPFLALPCI